MNHPLLAEEGKAIRDPVWGYIHVPAPVLALVDTEDFQRLRNITQLGYVHLVYPGARHSRFEHSLGVYHLAKQFLARLLDSDPPLELADEDVRVFIAATLLHDIGHYAFSHALEELELPYRIVSCNIARGEQFEPGFLELSPKNRMPAIVDHEPPGSYGTEPVSVFESGAILL